MKQVFSPVRREIMFIYELGTDRTSLAGLRANDIKVSWPCIRARDNTRTK